MQKKIIATLLAVCFVSVAGIASAQTLPSLEIEIEVDDIELNLGSAVAEDRGIANKGDNDGNINITDEIEGRNILLQGGANSISVNDSLRTFAFCEECVNDGFGVGDYYLNAGNVANQMNFDVFEDDFKGDITGSAYGNLVVHESTITRTMTHQFKPNHNTP